MIVFQWLFQRPMLLKEIHIYDISCTVSDLHSLLCRLNITYLEKLTLYADCKLTNSPAVASSAPRIRVGKLHLKNNQRVDTMTSLRSMLDIGHVISG